MIIYFFVNGYARLLAYWRHMLGLSQGLCLILLLVWLGPLKADPLPLKLELHNDIVPLSTHLRVLEDASHQLTLAKILENEKNHIKQWQNASEVSYSLSSWWMRVDVINQDNTNPYWYLHFKDIEPQALRVYLLAEDQANTPYSLPFIKELRQPIFRLDLNLNKKYSIYIEQYNTSRLVNFNLSLVNPDSLIRLVPSDHAFYALIFGGLLVLALYNLITFLNLKELSYLSLAVFITSNCLALSSQSGMLNLVFSTANANKANLFFAVLTIASANSFFYYLMNIPKRLPLMANFFRIHFWLTVFLGCIIYIVPFGLFFISVLGLMILAIATPVLLGLYKANIPEAKSFVWAYIVILVSCIPILLHGVGLIADLVLPLKILLVGFLIFTLLLSLNQSMRTRELREQAQQIEASGKAKDAFLMTMSHELRTPMHAVVSSGTLLQQTQLTEQQANYVAKLQASAQHMLSLINNILDVSRMSHVKPEVHEQSFTLQFLLDNLEKLLGDQARQKGLSFDLVSEYPPQTLLLGDAMSLSQILLNLLDNAVKFTDSGSVSLTIRAVGYWRDKIELKFEVSDTGLGLSLKEQARVFEPFFQANATSNRRYRGTGLGLTISHNLAKHLGGHLELASKLGQGSSFSFKLSLKLAEAQLAPAESPSAVSLQRNYQEKIVLLVDDDPLNQFFGQELLAALGVKVEVASSGEKTLAKLGVKYYDLILMDVSMPDLDGYQTTQLIRNTLGLRSLPIVALTAHAIAGERERCLAAGMNDYLAKPFSIQDLDSMLKKWLIDADS